MDATVEKFASWAIVEVMGHKKLAGYVSEQPIAGSALLRVDVPATEPAPGEAGGSTAAYTQLVGVGSIYCLTPTTEDVARRVARQLERYRSPVPLALPAPARAADDAEYELDEDEYDDEDDDLPSEAARVDAGAAAADSCAPADTPREGHDG